MRSVGAYEAKRHLSQLLEQVAKGERITITKHGRPVAMLVPPDAKSPAEIADLMARMRAFRKGHRLDGVTIRELIDEGRR